MNKSLLFYLLLMFGLVANAQATLIDRGGGLIYDDDLNITWLQDANYAGTSGHIFGGLMKWDEAITWALNLEYYDSIRKITYSDWRLPTALDSCWGYFCNGSEMGHLFYIELGNTASSSGKALANRGHFYNIKTDLSYWAGTTYIVPSNAYDFDFNQGDQRNDGKATYHYTWAVRPGDVAPIPEPATLLLLGSGLIGLVVYRLRHKLT